ncbi:hypothetical protein LFWB_4830 [Candidatus Phytoplasma luffae]|uniref:Transmembrane protein n=1 Tax=Loofah witches'-broom phytoplasma TaxID=35773 RepID=A0A975IME1_LOWBP|nr:hypothetical protein [Candidatus Phytoplasma luffae]QTX03049.1 hypothetical protein LFWB_4830 [Candidatus Phytoplasma luffae]
MYSYQEIIEKFLQFFRQYFSTFVAFLTGFFSGFLVFLLLYSFSMIRTFNKKKNIKETKNNNFSKKDMLELIEKKQKKFQEENQKKNDDYFLHLFQNCQELILEISSKFYPDSSFPYLELTLDEVLILVQYIHDRVDELFNKKILFLFRRITLKKIILLRKSILEKKYIQKYKKTNKVLSRISNVVNVINPFHWTKKIFFKLFYNKILTKIGDTIILILGEEIYKIYSKTIFKSELNLNDLMEEIEKELNENKNNKN